MMTSITYRDFRDEIQTVTTTSQVDAERFIALCEECGSLIRAISGYVVTK